MKHLKTPSWSKSVIGGIRSLPGYPANPDHRQKEVIWELLQPEKIGITLTELLAMLPASSVSGFYFSHPDARYFGLGKVKRDQIGHYAARMEEPIELSEQWLANFLGLLIFTLSLYKQFTYTNIITMA